MKQESFDVDYFLNFFGAIPLRQWCVRTFCDPDGKRCAVGHLLTEEIPEPEALIDFYKNMRANDMIRALGQLFSVWTNGDLKAANFLIYDINNGAHKDYRQRTPRARILQALHDIKQLQQEQAAENDLRQCGVESIRRHAEQAETGRHDGDTAAITNQPIPARSAPHCASPSNVGPLPQSLSPVTSALAKSAPCSHLFISPGDSCVLCGFIKPATSPVQVGGGG